MITRGEMWQAEVLRVLHRSDAPVTAYEVLEVLRQTHGKVAPTTIYRALSTLTDCGRVHRVESLNAFIACQCDRHQHTSILSICEECGSVEESVAPELLDEISGLVSKSGFTPMRHVIEIHGMCGSCSVGKLQA
ncbi:transcriptional repressor [Roseibium sp. HPY-6]|uniref:Fur family transcriptional regulator n=1 Tax=Roseibium sp. HPY-6 TaxID=3229852 RepID=UPI00338EAFD0